MHKKPVNYNHLSNRTTGILITNLGSPDAPTPQALRRYLKEFLWDPRVVEINRLAWWLILNGIILQVRPKKSAAAYAQVWTPEGAPLIVNTEKQRAAIERELTSHIKRPFKVAMGMRYGNPSIKAALESLRESNIDRLLVFPLYPQHAAATTASTFDQISAVMQDWRYIPSTRFISHYHDDAGYIEALVSSIQRHWQSKGKPEKLMFSFHGMPAWSLTYGDPYYCQCHKTARLVAEKLGLNTDDWILAFQSRFGKAEWLKPYANETLKALGKEKLKSIDVICPGFSADCLETLEEMAVENKAVFQEAGGGEYRYIPALNDNADHIKALSQIILRNIEGWEGIVDLNAEEYQSTLQQQALLARTQGAKQ